MAGRIREESIAEVRQATDIVALIGEYVTLRPAGGTRMTGSRVTLDGIAGTVVIESKE